MSTGSSPSHISDVSMTSDHEPINALIELRDVWKPVRGVEEEKDDTMEAYLFHQRQREQLKKFQELIIDLLEWFSGYEDHDLVVPKVIVSFRSSKCDQIMLVKECIQEFIVDEFDNFNGKVRRLVYVWSKWLFKELESLQKFQFRRNDDLIKFHQLVQNIKGELLLVIEILKYWRLD